MLYTIPCPPPRLHLRLSTFHFLLFTSLRLPSDFSLTKCLPSHNSPIDHSQILFHLPSLDFVCNLLTALCLLPTPSLLTVFALTPPRVSRLTFADLRLPKTFPENIRQICRIAFHHSFPLIGPGFFEMQLMSSTECTRAGATSAICVVDIPSNART